MIPRGLVKNEEKRVKPTTRQAEPAAAICQKLRRGARVGVPLASSSRFQSWFNPKAEPPAANVIRKVSLVAYINPTPAPANNAQPIRRVRQYRQPAAIARKEKKTSSISWM